jgi:hypothetical protein
MSNDDSAVAAAAGGQGDSVIVELRSVAALDDGWRWLLVAEAV